MSNVLFTLDLTVQDFAQPSRLKTRLEQKFQEHRVRGLRVYNYSHYGTLAIYNYGRKEDYSVGLNRAAVDYAGLDDNYALGRSGEVVYRRNIYKGYWQWVWWSYFYVGVGKGLYTYNYGNYYCNRSWYWASWYCRRKYTWVANWKWKYGSMTTIRRPRDLVEFMNRNMGDRIKAKVVSEKYVDEPPPRGAPRNVAQKYYRRRWKGTIKISNVAGDDVFLYSNPTNKLFDTRRGANIGQWYYRSSGKRSYSYPRTRIPAGGSITLNNVDMMEYNGPDNQLVTNFGVTPLVKYIRDKGITEEETKEMRDYLVSYMTDAVRDVHNSVNKRDGFEDEESEKPLETIVDTVTPAGSLVEGYNDYSQAWNAIAERQNFDSLATMDTLVKDINMYGVESRDLYQEYEASKRKETHILRRKDQVEKQYQRERIFEIVAWVLASLTVFFVLYTQVVEPAFAALGLLVSLIVSMGLVAWWYMSPMFFGSRVSL